MGERLMKYYNYVGEKAGLAGKMKLARITKIPSTEAAMEKDSAQNIELFRRAVESILGETSPRY
ncbi:MAG: hypothetical protein JXR76_24760 [Deltaproteobacteria bacterium]|nr:hypothetical protein [Deltaproteobacteria bacterium]